MADCHDSVSRSIDAELADDDAASMLAGQADIVDAVLAANRVFVAVAAGALAGLEPEVTLPQFRALVLIDIHRSMTVAQLADALGVVAEMTGNLTILAPAMVAVGLAYLIVLHDDRTIYRSQLVNRGEAVAARLTTRSPMQPTAEAIPGAPVVDGERRFIGTVRLFDDGAGRSDQPTNWKW